MSLVGSDNIVSAKTPVDHNHVLPTAPDRPMVEAYFLGIKARIENEGNQRFYTDGVTGKYLNISDLEVKARQVAKLFTSMGVGRGDIVQISVPNSLEFVPLVLGTWVCGAVPSLTDPDLSVATVRAQVEDTQAKVIICTPGKVRKFHEALDQLHASTQLVLLHDDEENLQFIQNADIPVLSQLLAICDQLPNPKPISDFSLDDIAIICWSSGTTGTPKGIQVSFQLVKHRMKPSANDFSAPDLLTTCMFHISGIGKLLMTAFNQQVIFFQDADLVQDISLILQACHKYRAGKVFLGSHHCAQLVNMSEVPSGLDLSCVRLVYPVGARVHNAMLADLKAFFPNMTLCNCYTMTELGFFVSYSFDPNCLGSVAEGSQVKIVDPVTKMALGPNQTGEIVVKPPYPFAGYYKQPLETTRFCDPDGFCHTGDFGHFDEQGLLYYDGRMKEIIKYRNNHIYPMELENLIQHLPGVAEVGVYGQPDPASQELAVAVVRLAPGATLREAEIKKHVAEQVDDFKQLRGGVRFVDVPLPRSAVGKVMRNKLAYI